MKLNEKNQIISANKNDWESYKKSKINNLTGKCLGRMMK